MSAYNMPADPHDTPALRPYVVTTPTGQLLAAGTDESPLALLNAMTADARGDDWGSEFSWVSIPHEDFTGQSGVCYVWEFRHPALATLFLTLAEDGAPMDDIDWPLGSEPVLHTYCMDAPQ